VIPNLHSPRIGEVLAALCQQKRVDRNLYEILVVGRDRYGLVRQHAAKDKRVIFLESERDLNPAEARNRGIKAARGKLVFFIDADCIAPSAWMETLLKTYHEGHPVVGGPIWFEDGDFWILSDNVAHFHDLLPDIGRGDNRHYMLATANMLVEKVILENVGMFDESFPTAEDFGLSRRIRNAGYDLFFEPEAKIIHLPVRDSLGAVLRHSAAWASNSIRVRKWYRDELESPWFLFHPMLLRRYWYTAPVVFLTKLVWCWAAARQVAAGRHKP